MKLLAYAMDYWSEGTLKALFLEHEVKTQQPKYLKVSRLSITDVSLCYFRVTLALWDVYCNLMANRVKHNERC